MKSSLSAQVFMKKQNGKLVQNVLLVQVIFGSPSRKCAGSGICAMEPVNGIPENESSDCKPVLARLSAMPGQMILVMRVNKNALSPAMRRKYFSAEGFEVEEDFIIPRPIKEALEVDRERIGRGICGLEESDGFYDVFL